MSRKKLSELQVGEKGRITALHSTGNIKHRLIDMGVIAGTEVTVIKYAPLKDPLEIKIKNFNLALRVSEASTIEVETESEA